MRTAKGGEVMEGGRGGGDDESEVLASFVFCESLKFIICHCPRHAHQKVKRYSSTYPMREGCFDRVY